MGRLPGLVGCLHVAVAGLALGRGWASAWSIWSTRVTSLGVHVPVFSDLAGLEGAAQQTVARAHHLPDVRCVNNGTTPLNHSFISWKSK